MGAPDRPALSCLEPWQATTSCSLDFIVRSVSVNVSSSDRPPCSLTLKFVVLASSSVEGRKNQ